MARYADSHCHLADPAFDADRAQVVERARVAGCASIICVGESIERAERARSLAAEHAGLIRFTAGIHPHDAASFDRSRDIPLLAELMRQGACAVGECGLDYHYDHSPREKQREALDAQLGLAADTGLPVVIHSRKAESDTRAMLDAARAARVRGVMHCFTGPADIAELALAAGWFISFAGVVTFKSWTDAALVRLVPADRILAESDAPYLTPVPYRGKRNEPAHVSLTIAALARMRSEDPGTLGEAVLANTESLFGYGERAAVANDK